MCVELELEYISITANGQNGSAYAFWDREQHIEIVDLYLLVLYSTPITIHIVYSDSLFAHGQGCSGHGPLGAALMGQSQPESE